jgi:hypothetical protein
MFAGFARILAAIDSPEEVIAAGHPGDAMRCSGLAMVNSLGF